MEVPEPAMNTELKLCISFESSTDSINRDRIVILAHHTDDPTKLSVYFSLENWCFRAPTAGSYYFGVFIQNSDNTLEPPATPPEILIRTVPTCKYSFQNHSFYTRSDLFMFIHQIKFNCLIDQNIH